MYSLYGDVVLDPFMGTGTTAIAAISSGRNSIGYEIDATFQNIINNNINNISIEKLNKVIKDRIDKHKEFIELRKEENKDIKHFNPILNLPVMTSQETAMGFFNIDKISNNSLITEVFYTPIKICYDL